MTSDGQYGRPLHVTGGGTSTDTSRIEQYLEVIAKKLGCDMSPFDKCQNTDTGCNRERWQHGWLSAYDCNGFVERKP
jgi:hypothetical protein